MELLALTISPPLKGSPDYQYNEQGDLLRRLLHRACKHYCMYPELDEGRLHWHGTISINDERKWFMQVLPTIIKNIGFVKVKPITNLVGWNVYCLKNWAYTQWLFRGNTHLTKQTIIPIYPYKLSHKKSPKITISPVRTLLDYGFTIV